MDINKLFHEALLADAAYVDKLPIGLNDVELVTALKTREGFTQAQAEYFAEHFIVVQQDDNPETGFSASMFQEIKEDGTLGQYHLAMRGTNGSPLFGADADDNLHNILDGISYLQVADLINFYLRLTAPQGGDVAQFKFEEVVTPLDAAPPEGAIFFGYEYGDEDEDGDGVEDIIGEIYLTFKPDINAIGLGSIPPQNGKDVLLNVTGHSLGGHLASAFTLLFPSSTLQTTTFNSAGFIGNYFDEFASIIDYGIQSALPNFAFATNKVTCPSTPVMTYQLKEAA